MYAEQVFVKRLKERGFIASRVPASNATILVFVGCEIQHFIGDVRFYGNVIFFGK